MRVTIKGQVTIPKNIRDHLGIEPGSEVEFVPDERGVRLRMVGQKFSKEESERRFREWAESVAGLIDTGGLDGKAYVDWLRGPRDDLDAHCHQCADRCPGSRPAGSGVVTQRGEIRW